MRAHEQHLAHDVAAHLCEEELGAVAVVEMGRREHGGVVLEEAHVVCADDIAAQRVVGVVEELDKRLHVLAQVGAQPAHGFVVLDNDHVEPVEVHRRGRGGAVVVDLLDGRRRHVEQLVGELVEELAHLFAVAVDYRRVAQVGDDELLQIVDRIHFFFEGVYDERHDLLHAHLGVYVGVKGHAQRGQLVDAFVEL